MPAKTSKQSDDLKIFISNRESICDECKEALGKNAWILLAGEKGALCMSCADLDHLLFLPSGDVGLTRRARKYSTLSAIVLKWSKAEAECFADADVRERRRARQAERRAELDKNYVDNFARRIGELFPNSPPGTDKIVAEHACLKYSGRVGRTTKAKALDDTAVRLAVIAHIRHTMTSYDELLANGHERFDARKRIEHQVAALLDVWQSS